MLVLPTKYFLLLAKNSKLRLNEMCTGGESERADLTDRLLASLVHDIPTDTEQRQIDEVRRWIAQIDSEEVTLIPAHIASEQVRQLVESAQIGS